MANHFRGSVNKGAFLAALVVVSVLAGLAPALAQDKSSGPVTPREQFDPARDPSEDLASAVEKAAKSGQRILLDVGGEWCPWCRKLDKFFQENNDVREFLRANFLVVKVNFSKENQNERFLAQYPAIKGYPHLFVLDSSGKLLHSQNTGELESGDHHDHDKVLAFLKKWAPASPRS